MDRNSREYREWHDDPDQPWNCDLCGARKVKHWNWTQDRKRHRLIPIPREYRGCCYAFTRRTEYLTPEQPHTAAGETTE